MPGMTRPATARRQEEALLARPRQAALLTAGVLALTAVVFALVADHGALARIQRLDDAWLRLMISGRAPPLTAIAKVFNVLGLVYVTLPVRIVLAGFLALRRRWWHLAAFASAIVLSEVLIGSLKGVYDRARPPGALVATSGASFPSGHAIAASVTVVAAVIALVPPGRRRPCLPGRPLALRRHRRDPARHLLRPGHRAGSRPVPAAAEQAAAGRRDAVPRGRSPGPPR
jgi:membrane-associated phospholipid phosphatase